MNTDLLPELAQYIAVLTTSMEKTHHAQDRLLYVQHLAAAAAIFESLQHSNFEQARKHVGDEKRAFGWSFLAGEEGSAAESAFVRFERLFEEKIGQ